MLLVLLYLEKSPPVVLLQLLAPLLQATPPLTVPPQQLDVVHRRLQDAPLVLPHVSHQLIIGLILGPKQRAELLDPIVDVEPSSTLNHVVIVLLDPVLGEHFQIVFTKRLLLWRIF